MAKKFFTSESVTEGHPDKICDQISDAILDALLEADPMSRVACETTTTTGIVTVMGEITTRAHIDIQSIIRETVREIGYDRAKYGFDCDTCAIVNMIHGQSPDIALGVDKSLEAKEGEITDSFDTGAGDQGLMFGYACDETPELMPLPISLAHKLAIRLTKVRRDGTLPYLRPDGKTQVTVEYDDGKPVRIDAIVVSSQHDPDVSLDKIREDIINNVIVPTISVRIARRRDEDLCQSDRTFCRRRTSRRQRFDRTQDHRRHLRRLFASRRRLLLGQGPDQGRPLCVLRGALHSEEYRRRRTCFEVRGADCLRNRRRKAGIGHD